MKLIRRIEESNLSLVHKLYGSNINKVEEKIKGLVDLVFGKSESAIDFDFFDIKGSVLLYGIPGIGKTSVMYNCMSYALEKYAVDCYELPTTDIIEPELGKATQNMVEALREFEELDKAILFIDELDRICINRTSDELSELKRMVIELMCFLDRLNLSQKKIFLSCTNVIEQIDKALFRRFSICEDIKEPTQNDLLTFANDCMKKACFSGEIYDIPNGISTFDTIKSIFRNAILEHANVQDFFVVGGSINGHANNVC